MAMRGTHANRVVPQERSDEERSRKIGGYKKDLGPKSKVFFVAGTGIIDLCLLQCLDSNLADYGILSYQN
jgi:hypothetical protein